jgi:clan AA aspartic protease (TIGR02281 family)
MKLIKYLSIFLSVSLGANLWFTWSWYQQNRINNETNNKLDVRTKAPNSHVWATSNAENELTISNSNQAQASDGQSVTNQKQNTNQASYLKRLKTLAKQQEFEILEYEVRAYLRLYPQDLEAMILEALAYYHNKPLNTALVHYHELLSKPLTPMQQNDIEELIAVNTTRVIQQFSGDGAWDLLAEFLEPLVQIAPLNRQYLMALASAYGMQSQFTLMEAVLANFPPDDLRASRLRENITARTNNAPQGEPQMELPDRATETLVGNRHADVLLQQKQGHFVTEARVHNTSVTLLVDTGASTTALSNEKFNTIASNQIEFIGVFKVNTAGGTIEAPIYKVKRITIGQRTIVNTSVLILPKENLGRFDGLLGMNVLSQFDLVYDATSETMRMYKKS